MTWFSQISLAKNFYETNGRNQANNSRYTFSNNSRSVLFSQMLNPNILLLNVCSRPISVWLISRIWHCIQVHCNSAHCTAQQTWKKTIFLHKQGLIQNHFNWKKCINFDKSEFARKQHKMCLTTNISKPRLPHVNRGKNYVINFVFSSF